MLRRACRRFQRDYEAGPVAGRTPSHGETCPLCHDWASEVAGLRTCGVDLPLTKGMKPRLHNIAVPDEPSRPGDITSEISPSLGPLPQFPMPAGLASRLRQIPSRRDLRMLPPFWLTRPRTAVAASYFAAVVIMLAIGNPNLVGQKTKSFLGRGVTLTMREAGSIAPRTLLSAGTSVFHTCQLANEAMQRLLDQLSPRPAEAPAHAGQPGSPKGNPGAAPPSEKKETRHGNSPSR